MGFFGLHAMTAGTYVGEGLQGADGGPGKTAFLKDGLLKGFILMGRDEAGIYTSLIEEQVPSWTG